MLSGMARHVSLRTECEKYSEELSAFLKDKDTLLIDVVKALKRITNEWRSWNHKLFGGLSPKAYVASVDQVSFSIFFLQAFCDLRKRYQ